MGRKCISDCMIICITGMPGSGKTELAGMLAGKGFRVFEIGDLVRRAVKKAGLPTTEKNVGAYATKHRQETGKMDIFAREAVMEIESIKAKDIVVAGARNEQEIDYLKENLKNVFTVAIVAAPQVRFDRLSLRGRSDDEITYDKFLARDEREKKYGIESAIANADYIILADAERGVLELNDEIDYMIAQMRAVGAHGSRK